MSALKAPSSSLPSAGPSSAATLADINLNDLRIEVPTVSREDGSDDDDDDAPPAFPAINSAQRSRPAASSSRPEQASSPSQSSTATSGSTSAKSSSLRAVLGVPASSLGAPSSRGASTGSGGLAVGGARGGLGVPPSTKSVTTRTRGKVALEPGHSPLDWARVKNSTDLRGGVTQLMRITPSELKKHKSPDDAWSAFQGKVYNITPYLKFHPGGQPELMRVAGRDGTRLFMLTHSWVTIDSMIDTAMVGILVPEPSKSDS